MNKLILEKIIKESLIEDIGYSDLASDLCVSDQELSIATIISKEKDDVVLCGIDIAELIFKTVDNELKVYKYFKDGAIIKNKDTVLKVEGKAQSILKAERVVLNFMMKLSGISTLTNSYVKKLNGTNTKLLDTRKTTPGLRFLEKYATLIGGGHNHRVCLNDGLMIKENHIRASGSITNAVKKAKENKPLMVKIEVETTNLEEVEEALKAKVDIIMLDNMSDEMMTKAVKLINGQCLTEASGNVTIERLEKIAKCGVDYVSTSATITKSKWSDFSLLFEVKEKSVIKQECCVCSTKENLIKKDNIQFGGDFGGDLLKAKVCHNCYGKLYNDSNFYHEFKKRNTELFESWSL